MEVLLISFSLRGKNCSRQGHEFEGGPHFPSITDMNWVLISQQWHLFPISCCQRTERRSNLVPLKPSGSKVHLIL